MKLFLLAALALTLFSTAAWAQSVNSENPAPLQPGINKSFVDNMVGPHYWYFSGGPGKTNVHLKCKNFVLSGKTYESALNVIFSDAANTWHIPKIIDSRGQDADYTFDGNSNSPTKLLLSVFAPPTGVIGFGGRYEMNLLHSSKA